MVFAWEVVETCAKVPSAREKRPIVGHGEAHAWWRDPPGWCPRETGSRAWRL